jgi:hypothetical protein
LSGNQSGHILKKMECHFLGNLLISAELLFFCSFSNGLGELFSFRSSGSFTG